VSDAKSCPQQRDGKEKAERQRLDSGVDELVAADDVCCDEREEQRRKDGVDEDAGWGLSTCRPAAQG